MLVFLALLLMIKIVLKNALKIVLKNAIIIVLKNYDRSNKRCHFSRLLRLKETKS